VVQNTSRCSPSSSPVGAAFFVAEPQPARLVAIASATIATAHA
jgi:hypothetical protein